MAADLGPAETGRRLLKLLKAGKSLEGKDFAWAELPDADLRGAELSSCRLEGADLQGALLKGARLVAAQLKGADLRRADLRQADLRGADLLQARLVRADLRGAELRGARLPRADLQGALIEGADLREAVLQGTRLRDLELREARLAGADLRWSDLQGANLQRAALEGVRLQGARLGGADLRVANLQRADLAGLDLQSTDLQRADLQRADLQGTDLRGGRLQGAYLQGADLRGADLRGADLRGANLRGARMQEAQLRAADLRGANLLECIGLDTDQGGCLLDAHTYHNSGWTLDVLLAWRRGGARLEDFPAAWPEAVALHLRGARPGLALLFRKRPGRLDRHLVEAVAMGVLGPEADCEVELIGGAGARSSLHLSGPPPQHLARLAEVLRTREWRHHELSDTAGRMRAMLTPPLLKRLEELLERADRFELWVEEGGRLQKQREWSPRPPRMKVAAVPVG